MKEKGETDVRKQGFSEVMGKCQAKIQLTIKLGKNTLKYNTTETINHCH